MAPRLWALADAVDGERKCYIDDPLLPQEDSGRAATTLSTAPPVRRRIGKTAANRL